MIYLRKIIATSFQLYKNMDDGITITNNENVNVYIVKVWGIRYRHYMKYDIEKALVQNKTIPNCIGEFQNTVYSFLLEDFGIPWEIFLCAYVPFFSYPSYCHGPQFS